MKNFKISLKAEVGSRAGVADILKRSGDAVLIQRGAPRWLLLRCPCGCGEDIPVNLDARAGKAWRIYRSQGSGLTLFRQFGAIPVARAILLSGAIGS